jgi:hypothetical protein
VIKSHIVQSEQLVREENQPELQKMREEILAQCKQMVLHMLRERRER